MLCTTSVLKRVISLSGEHIIIAKENAACGWWDTRFGEVYSSNRMISRPKVWWYAIAYAMDKNKKTPRLWCFFVLWCTFRDSTLARTARSVIRRENSSTGRVFYTAPTSNPFGVCKRKTPRKVVFLFYGAPSGIRTRDPLIKSQLLYQLS